MTRVSSIPSFVTSNKLTNIHNDYGFFSEDSSNGVGSMSKSHEKGKPSETSRVFSSLSSNAVSTSRSPTRSKSEETSSLRLQLTCNGSGSQSSKVKSKCSCLFTIGRSGVIFTPMPQPFGETNVFSECLVTSSPSPMYNLDLLMVQSNPCLPVVLFLLYWVSRCTVQHNPSQSIFGWLDRSDSSADSSEGVEFCCGRRIATARSSLDRHWLTLLSIGCSISEPYFLLNCGYWELSCLLNRGWKYAPREGPNINLSNL